MMRFSTLLKNPAEWMRADGPHNDIVVSSRVRLARNLSGHSFPGWAKAEERSDLLAIVRPAVEDLPEMQNAFSQEMTKLSAIEKQVLVERHLVSREHAAKSVGCATVMNRNQSISIMINEEDHLRIQALRPGLQLLKAYQVLDKIDDQLEATLPYAFDPKYGYLTACPTNLGTGLRASAMLHLPALVLSDQINQTIQAANKIGLAVRGLYGEGTEALANLFQISNQTTLGQDEKSIIQHLDKVIVRIIENEENARRKLLEDQPTMLQDQIGRAYAILRYAYIIPSKEAMNFLSMIRLGIDLGAFSADERDVINVLLTEIQPAHLQIEAKRKLNAAQRDVLRAEIVRRHLKNLTEPRFDDILTQEPDDE
ncbi:MAG: protein arginine kinase [Verrucomicrobiales bacterium]|nr:protein arginine kinase [Verrucomicrobiales bacterium]